jgi:hypothetical protein
MLSEKQQNTKKNRSLDAKNEKKQQMKMKAKKGFQRMTDI